MDQPDTKRVAGQSRSWSSSVPANLSYKTNECKEQSSGSEHASSTDWHTLSEETKGYYRSIDSAKRSA